MLVVNFNLVAPKTVNLACKTCIQIQEKELKEPTRYNNSEKLIYLSDQGIQELNYSNRYMNNLMRK